LGTVPNLAARPGRGRSHFVRKLLLRRETAIFVVALALVIYFSVRNSNFDSYANVVTIVQYIAPIVVIGAGEVLVLVLAEIDLSAGQTFLLSSWIVALLWKGGVPLGLAIAISLVCCLAVGAVNGMITVLLGLPSFVTTLGMYFLLTGVVLVTSGDTQTDMPGVTGHFGLAFGLNSWSEIGWAMAIAGLIWFVLKRTRFGTHVTATGGNSVAAAEAGIPIKRVKIWCFMILALVAGFIGIIDSIRIGSLDPGAPGTAEMFLAVSAAVIGGTALTGGRGTVLGTIIGAVVLGVLEDGFNLIGVSANAFTLAEGVVILVAMAVNVQLNRMITRRER
jgi:simple sugar transport system permease protein